MSVYYHKPIVIVIVVAAVAFQEWILTCYSGRHKGIMDT